MLNTEFLRDPIWQFIGVVVAVLIGGVPGVLWLMRRRRATAVSRHEEIIAELKKHLPTGGLPGVAKHKKRKSDGILLANLSSDFVNQFPVPVGILAAHLDQFYTPENFGASDWLTVFRRLTEENYFQPLHERSARRIGLESKLNPGPKLEKWLRASIERKRDVAGLNDDG